MSQNSDIQAQHQAAARTGREASTVLAAAEKSYFGARQAKLLKDAFRAIDNDDLTPSMALRTLFQLHEHDRVTKDLKKLVKDGLRASEKISSSL